MPVYCLSVKMTLDNVAALERRPGNYWKFDFKDGSSDEVRKDVTISDIDEEAMEGSRGVANLTIKFAESGSTNNASVMEITKGGSVTRDVTGEDSEQFVPVFAMECRGMEPVAWHAGEDFIVVTKGGGQRFEEVNLADGDWNEVEDKKSKLVAITDLECVDGRLPACLPACCCCCCAHHSPPFLRYKIDVVRAADMK